MKIRHSPVKSNLILKTNLNSFAYRVFAQSYRKVIKPGGLQQNQVSSSAFKSNQFQNFLPVPKF